MKNKIREKFIASVMLSAFVVTTSLPAFAMIEYQGYDMSKPAIRSSEVTSLDFRSDVKIPNADSVVNLSLRDADITQVLRMFADQAGMNIIFADGVQGTVTMDLVDIPLNEALDLVVTTKGLFYDIQANTLVVSTVDNSLTMASNKSMTLIPVKYVNAAPLAYFLNANVFKKNGVNPGVSIKPAVTVNPATNELIVMGSYSDVAMARKIVEQFDKKPTITTFKVNHTTPAEMANLICSTLIPSTISSGASGGGGGSSSSASGFAAGVPTGFASDEGGSGGDEGGSISVGGGKLVCSTESSVAADDLTGLSFINLSVSYFPTLGTVQIIGGSESQLDIIREYIAANDKKAPQAYLEVQIISLNEDGSKTFDNTWQFLSKNFTFNAGGGQGFSTDPMYPVFFAGHGFTILDPESYDPETGKYEEIGKVGKWGSSPQLLYSVNYMIENKKGRVLANPKILLTSGQTSTIDLTGDYVKKVTAQYLDNGASSAAQVQKEYEIGDDNGIKVSITPFISPDGYVTLDIKPEYKTIASQLYTVTDTGDKDLAATLLQRRDLNLKGVRIKDGETLVIGGMIQETEAKTVTKIPFLGDLPVVGMFFRSTGTTKKKEEMVIMLTPQIVVDTEDAVADDNML